MNKFERRKISREKEFEKRNKKANSDRKAKQVYKREKFKI